MATDSRFIAPTVTVAFKLISDPSTALLAWTTTPWTLPTNLALCVHPDFTYIKIHDKERDTNFILCEKLLSTLYKDAAKAKKEKKYEVLETYKGKDLVGLQYEPLFNYFKEKVSLRNLRLLEGPNTEKFPSSVTVRRARIQGRRRHLRYRYLGYWYRPPSSRLR